MITSFCCVKFNPGAFFARSLFLRITLCYLRSMERTKESVNAFYGALLLFHSRSTYHFTEEKKRFPLLLFYSVFHSQSDARYCSHGHNNYSTEKAKVKQMTRVRRTMSSALYAAV